MNYEKMAKAGLIKTLVSLQSISESAQSADAPQRLLRELRETQPKAGAALRESEQLRNLSTYLQAAREEERARIAREIHDELGQALTALKMDLFWLEKRLPEGRKFLNKKTKAMTKLINMTINAVQRISAELRPGLKERSFLSAFW